MIDMPEEPNRIPPSQPTYGAYGIENPDNIDLVRVISDLWARKWIILGVTAAFAVADAARHNTAIPSKQ